METGASRLLGCCGELLEQRQAARKNARPLGNLMQPPDKSDGDSPARTITTLSSREVYRNRWIRVREDEILRSNGQKGIYGVVEKEDGAIILPIEDGHIWLVEQFRYTIQERTLELPQGAWERAIEDPEELARGELKEELGMEAAQM